MRRMIPQKQIDVLNKIQDGGDLPGVIVDNAILISGTAAEGEAVVAGNESLNIAADNTLIPGEQGNASIYLGGGDNPYIDVWVDGEQIATFGYDADADSSQISIGDSDLVLNANSSLKEINFGVSEDQNEFNIGYDGTNYGMWLGDNPVQSGVIINSDGIRLPGLPTSDPQVEGALWNDNGTLKISSGS